VGFEAKDGDGEGWVAGRDVIHILGKATGDVQECILEKRHAGGDLRELGSWFLSYITFCSPMRRGNNISTVLGQFLIAPDFDFRKTFF